MELYTIICLSNQAFSMPMKTNKWHIMTRLAQRGHNVIFIDPPTRFKALKALIKGKLGLKQFLTGSREENRNLSVYSPIHLFNFKPFSDFNLWFHMSRIRGLINKFPKRKTVLWVYHFDYPDLEELVKKLDFDLLIYDVVDEYTAFPEYSKGSTSNKGLVALIEGLDDALKVRLNQGGAYGKDWVVKREKWLSENADLIFASAPGLVIKFTSILQKLGRSSDILHYLPNGADFEKFKDVKRLKESSPEDISKLPRPRIISIGALDTYKMNLPLIELCARTYPNYSFVLIGSPVEDKDSSFLALKSLPNVYMLGLKPWDQTPFYVAASDAYIIPYNLNDYTIGGCFPVKFHEALSAGMPTIVTNLPAYKEFRDVCYIAQNDQDFVNKIKIALEEDSEDRFKARQAVAKENTWDGKADKQIRFIKEKLS